MNKYKITEKDNQFWQTLNQTITKAPDFYTALSIALLQVCEITGWDYGEAWIPCTNDNLLELSPVWHINTRRDRITTSALEQFRLCSEDLS